MELQLELASPIKSYVSLHVTHVTMDMYVYVCVCVCGCQPSYLATSLHLPAAVGQLSACVALLAKRLHYTQLI